MNPQQEMLTRLPATPVRLAKVPTGAPAQKSWHVKRTRVMEKVFDSLCCDRAPRLVGLVGNSGSGKTTTASEAVRSNKLLLFFADGIVWLHVDKDAKGRLPMLMLQLATLYYEDVGGSVGRPPTRLDVGEAFINEQIAKGRSGRGLRCLVIADNVWEKEVIAKLQETGMWVLLTTRNETLMSDADSEAIRIDELSQADAEMVLRRAAELPPDVRLPDAAIDLIELCGRVAMDLAFAGRWGVVRGRNDRSAWTDAADRVNTQLRNVGLDTSRGIGERAVKRRRAILCAGFQYLAVGTDDERIQWLYLALGALPDGHPFGVMDAAALLYDRNVSAEDEAAVREVVDTLERWSILRTSSGKYRMHDDHSSFARENLMDRGDVRRPAAKRWVKRISSLEMLVSVGEFVLKGLWSAVEQVGGESWRICRPYEETLASMDYSDPQLRRCMEAVARFYSAQSEWEAESAMWRRLLEVERSVLGHDHPYVMNTLGDLARCAQQMGKPGEAEGWQQKQQEVFPLALARMRLHGGAEGNEAETANGLKSVAAGMVRLGPSDGTAREAESMLRRALEIEEVALGLDHVQVADTLCEMGKCILQAGRHEEAEGYLRRGLVIREVKLGSKDVLVAYMLDQLGLCVRTAGRPEEAIGLLRQSLAVKEAKLGSDSVEIAYTLHELGVCLGQTKRNAEAEQILQRCLEIKETTLGAHDLKVAYTLHELGVCISAAGRQGDAEQLFTRALEIERAKLGTDNVSVGTTLFRLGVCLRGLGQQEDAKRVLMQSLDICRSKMGPHSAESSAVLAQLALCERESEGTE